MAKQININHLRINDERIKQYVDTETAKAGKHEIVNSAGTALPPEPNIRFNGLDATDNAQDATSEISAKGLNADDLAEIVSTTPANYAVGNTAMYSTTEQIVGRWIDGRPIYQITTILPSLVTITKNTWNNIADVSALSIEQIVGLELYLTTNGAGYLDFSEVSNGTLRVFGHGTANYGARGFTIKYTKTGD